MPLNPNDYRVPPDTRTILSRFKPNDDAGLTREQGEQAFAKLSARLVELQELLYAQGKHSMLVVLQGMDTSGKDGTIRDVFGPLNAQGCSVASFKKPSTLELAHDYLWRIHQQTPAKGHITLFNRSHYEDVLVVRVLNLVPEERWRRRYDHINDFERLIADEGTLVFKFFLHISKDYQKERLQRRLDRPDKLWKFEPGDLEMRKHWDAFQEAYDAALCRCSTMHAPWHIIPAEKKWFRNLLIAQVLVESLEALDMKFPTSTIDPKSIIID